MLTLRLTLHVVRHYKTPIIPKYNYSYTGISLDSEVGGVGGWAADPSYPSFPPQEKNTHSTIQKHGQKLKNSKVKM